VDVTTADASIGATDYYGLSQNIEGANAAALGFGQAGTRYVTLSFWVKSTKTGTYTVCLQNSAQDRSYAAEYTVSSADTWEKKSLTIAVDTTGTWLYGSGIGLRVFWWLAAGSNFHMTAGAWAGAATSSTANQVNAMDSTSNNFKLALVQLEAGATATPFQQRDVTTELLLCQRYLPAASAGGTATTMIGAGQCSSTSAASIVYPFPVTPRSIPTGVTVSNAGHISVWQANKTVVAGTGIAFNAATSLQAGVLDITGASGLVAGDATTGFFNNTGGYVLFTGAEL
jgi:hypothetical protein